jgi:uncharacterized protein YndB with AHSA1/START domain
MMAETFEIKRVFAAPRERIWDAWTRPEQFARWFGPKGTSAEVHHFDLRPGGSLHSRLEAADGSVMWGKNIYREIDAPRRLVWEQSFSNAAAEIVPAPFPMPWPLRMLTTVLLDETDGGTLMTLTWEPIDATDEERASFIGMMASMTGGWTGTFDQLDAFLAEAD